MASEEGPCAETALRHVLAATRHTLGLRPAVRAWQRLEGELQALGVPPAVRDMLAQAVLEAITVAAFRRGRQGAWPPAAP
jgi:hypothetical protein